MVKCILNLPYIIVLRVFSHVVHHLVSEMSCSVVPFVNTQLAQGCCIKAILLC